MSVKNQILKATGLERNEGEDEQAFLTRVVKAIDKLDDATWEALPGAAQKWGQAALGAVNENKPIPRFPPAGKDEGEGNDSEEEESVSEEPKAKAKAKAKAEAPKAKAKAEAPKAKAKAKAEAPKKKEKGPRGPETGVKVEIKKLLFKTPDMSAEDVAAKLKAKGMKAADATVAAVRAEFRHTLRVLVDLGALKIDI